MLAAAPPPAPITPQLIEAAKKEGKVVWYTSVDLPLAEKIAKTFEAKYPGIAVRVERTGAERVFQRIGQEYGSNIYAVDVVNSSDAAHFIVWKRDGMLEPYRARGCREILSGRTQGPGRHVRQLPRLGCVIAYNTNLVKTEDAPKSFADLLDPKWKGKMVKAHPGYSGTIMTATFQMQRDLGWDYFEKLAKQNVMQVQSSADPPKKLALGERAVMADGNEYNIFHHERDGRPVELVYPTEGTPLIIGPNGMFKDAPNPECGAAVPEFCFTPDASSSSSMSAACARCIRRPRKRPGRTPFKDIKTMKDDAAAVEKMSEEIKARYAQAVQGLMGIPPRPSW